LQTRSEGDKVHAMKTKPEPPATCPQCGREHAGPAPEFCALGTTKADARAYRYDREVIADLLRAKINPENSR
jgi:hypothetical protein